MVKESTLQCVDYLIERYPDLKPCREDMKNAVIALCEMYRKGGKLLMVERIESRNSGIALIMAHCGDVVLVSKQYSAEVKEKIQNPQ